MVKEGGEEGEEGGVVVVVVVGEGGGRGGGLHLSVSPEDATDIPVLLFVVWLCHCALFLWC